MVYLVARLFLWCENGIVFLRPLQAPAGVFPEGAGSLPSLLRSRPPSALSERDHLFTGRCDLVISPLSRNLLRSLERQEEIGAPTKADEESSSPPQESNDFGESARGRWKWKREEKGTTAGLWRGRQIRGAIENYTGIGFTSGRFNRADMLTLIRVQCPCNIAISRQPRSTIGGSTESRGLWDRISSLDASCDEFAKVTARSKQDIKMSHCRHTFSQELLIYTKWCNKIRWHPWQFLQFFVPNDCTLQLLQAHFCLNDRWDSLWESVCTMFRYRRFVGDNNDSTMRREYA